MKKLVSITSTIFIVSCSPEIKGPDNVICTVFATGETFTAKRKNMSVEGDFLTVVDDAGYVRKFNMIESGSTAYVASCKERQVMPP